MGSGCDWNSHMQMRIHLLVVLISLSRLDCERFHCLSINQHFEFMRFVQTLNLFIAIARQPNLDFIFSVSWKRERNQGATPRSHRKSFEVLLLGDVRPNADSVAAGRAPGRADRK